MEKMVVTILSMVAQAERWRIIACSTDYKFFNEPTE